METRNANEIEKLLEDSDRTGGISLDFRHTNDSAAKELSTNMTRLMEISDKFFAQPLKIKMKDVRDGQAPDADRRYNCEYDPNNMLTGRYSSVNQIQRRK